MAEISKKLTGPEARQKQLLAEVSRYASQLQIITQVSTAVSTILDKIELLQKVVDLTKINFKLYHAHVYLLNEEEDTLVLVASTGEAGRQMVAQGWQIPLDAEQSLVARVARSRHGVIVNDVRSDPGWLPNQLLPETRSELAVPMIATGQLLGVLDVQSDKVDYFAEDNFRIQNMLAAQVAVTVQNAQLFERVNKANKEIQILNERLKTENMRMEAELDVSRRLQQMLLPGQAELAQIEGLEVVGFMQPADEVGGDYYDVLHHNDSVKIGIGDVTGHGLESGVVMLMAQTAIRTLLMSGVQDSTHFMDTLNRVMCANLQRMGVDKSMSLALLDYKRLTSQMSLSGQHEQVLVVRRGGKVEVKSTMGLGFPVGLVEEIAGLVNETEIMLEPGDGIVLFSDGFTEAENDAHEFYGLERLCRVVAEHWAKPAEDIKNEIVANVRRFIGENVVYDDLALLVIKQQK